MQALLRVVGNCDLPVSKFSVSSRRNSSVTCRARGYAASCARVPTSDRGHHRLLTSEARAFAALPGAGDEVAVRDFLVFAGLHAVLELVGGVHPRNLVQVRRSRTSPRSLYCD